MGRNYYRRYYENGILYEKVRNRAWDKRKPQLIRSCSKYELLFLKGLLPYVRKYVYLQLIATGDLDRMKCWKGTTAELWDAIEKAEQLPALTDLYSDLTGDLNPFSDFFADWRTEEEINRAWNSDYDDIDEILF